MGRNRNNKQDKMSPEEKDNNFNVVDNDINDEEIIMEIDEVLPSEEVEEVVEIKEEIKKIDFVRALCKYRKNNPERAIVMKDIESIELFTLKRLKSLLATEEEFFNIFDKF